MGILQSTVFSEPITIRRYPVQSINSYGAGVSGTPTDIPAMGSVQPANGQDLEMLTEGATSDDYRAILTESEVLIGEPDSGIPSDEIIVNATGITYIAIKVAHTRKVLPHYTVLASRKPEALNG